MYDDPKISTAMFAALVCAIHVMTTDTALAQNETTFTYQGELKENGDLATGSFDMDFSLWDAASAGNQIGSTFSLANIVVIEGIFTVDLDFGADAFDNGNRWLEMVVESTTLSPRTAITRAPYSIQTRGIFVDAIDNIGIGTLSPAFPLHVESSNKSPIFARYNGNIGGTYAINGNKDNGIAGGGVNGYAAAPNGFTVGVQGRSESTTGIGIRGVAAATSGLNYGVFGQTDSPQGYAGYFEGRGYFSDDVEMDGRLVADEGISFRSGGFVPMVYMYDSANGNLDRMVLAHSPNFFNWGLKYMEAVDDFAFVGGGVDQVRIDLNGSDAKPSFGGTLVIGDTGAGNISIDGNEIMARNNGSTSTLHLNADGGQINMGLYDIKPPLAYGRINSNGTIISASANVTSVVRYGEGRYRITIVGGVGVSDIIIANANNINASNLTQSQAINGDVLVDHWNTQLNEHTDSPFSFVIYRH